MEFYYSKEIDTSCTTTLFTIDFKFEDREFHCLVRAKAQGAVILYFLTLLDPEMDEVFAEPYILTERDKTLFIEAPLQKSEHAAVKFASIVALRQHLVMYQAAGQCNERYIA